MNNTNVNNYNSILATPIKIGNLIAKNRFVIQPMECGDAVMDGLPSKYTLKRYNDYALGGSGLVIIEAVTLQYETRSTNHQLMLDLGNASNMIFWKRFFANMKKKYPDTILIMQLQHAGEVASDTFSKRITIKNNPAFGGKLVDAEYVDNVIKQTIEAAKFLYDIGCDGVDIKFCHGYLGSQILRPYNDRDWKYGGSWDNRSRFAYEMCEGIRRVVPDKNFLVGAKVSAYEGFDGGQTLEETVKLVKGLEARGADYFVESLGHGHFSWSLMAPNHQNSQDVYQHLAAAKVLKSCLAPETVLIGGGLSILSKDLPQVSEYAINNGIFDMAALGRQAFADPYLPNQYFAGDTAHVKWCVCCDKCGELLVGGRNSYCAVYK